MKYSSFIDSSLVESSALNLPSKPFAWSLVTVLEAATSIRVECKDERVLLEKSAFLLALASSGRISEITARQGSGTGVAFHP